MINHFQLQYPERLQSWHQLRENIKHLSTLEQCIKIDEYWQQAPLVAHYLHPQDTTNWPDPWELIYDNEYCPVARALGICYTLHIMGYRDYAMVEASDEYGDEYILVMCGKYTLSYHPNTVVNNTLNQFKIKKTIDITQLTDKIR